MYGRVLISGVLLGVGILSTAVGQDNYVLRYLGGRRAEAFTESPAGDFILAGETSSRGYSRPYLVRFDANGDSAWARTFRDIEPYRFTSVTALENGTIVPGGGTHAEICFISGDGSRHTCTTYPNANTYNFVGDVYEHDGAIIAAVVTGSALWRGRARPIQRIVFDDASDGTAGDHPAFGVIVRFYTQDPIPPTVPVASAPLHDTTPRASPRPT